MELDFGRVEFSGRNQELKSLKGALERTANHKESSSCAKVCLIQGEAGTGKTALVDAFREILDYDKSFFCQGKFDQDKSASEPFSAIVDCLASLVDQVMESFNAEALKRTLEEEAPSEMRSLAMILPQIKEIGGRDEDEDSSTLGDLDYKSQWGFERLRLAIRSFIRILCQSQTIIFFFDDLQWMDEASLKVINTLVLDKRARNFLFIATHREVPADHLVEDFTAEISEECLTAIQLNNLGQDSVINIIAHLLRRDDDDVEPLAQVVHRKTNGNAFFVNQFLRLLHERGLLFYSPSTFRWEWSLDRILSETEIADNVLDLVSHKIKTMPSQLQTALTSAACLGSLRFDVEILIQILPVEEEEERHPQAESKEERFPDFDKILEIAVGEGLLDKLGVPGKYKFAHDRIRESAYSLLPKGEAKERLHLHFGRQLRQLHGDAEEGTYGEERLLLLAVNHLNAGANLITCQEEKIELAELNYRAAEVAFERSAFVPASEYLQVARCLLGDSRWDRHYELTLKVMTSLAHAYFCMGKHDQSKVAVDEVLKTARSLMDKLGAYRALILNLAQESKPEDAIQTTLMVLDELNVHLPRRFLKFHVARGMLKTKRIMQRISFDDLQNLPQLSDAMLLEAGEFIALLGETSVMAINMDFQLLAMFNSIWITFKHGGSKWTSLCIAVCGMLCAILNDFDSSSRYCDFALKLIQENNHPCQDARAAVLLNFFVAHWNKPLHDTLEPVLRSNRILLDYGDTTYLYLSVLTYASNYYNCGLRLDPLKKDLLRYIETLEDYGQTLFVRLLSSQTQLVLNLVGDTDDPLVLTGEVMDQDRCVHDWTKAKNLRALQTYYVCRMVLAFYFGDLELAEDLGSKMISPIQEGPTPWLVLRFFFEGLVAVSLAKKTGKRRYRRKARAMMGKIKKFRQGGNPNCHHMLLLLRAENMSLRGGQVTVQKAYNEAITAAGRVGFTHDHALANELAGVYFLPRDREWAGNYLSRAYELYNDWGAQAKVRQLETKYHDLLESSESVSSFGRRSMPVKARSRLEHMSSADQETFMAALK